MSALSVTAAGMIACLSETLFPRSLVQFFHSKRALIDYDNSLDIRKLFRLSFIATSVFCFQGFCFAIIPLLSDWTLSNDLLGYQQNKH